MILLDPDLEPSAAADAPKATSAKRAAASGPTAVPRNRRIPAARTLARFLAAAQAAVRLKGEVTVLLTTDAAIRKLNRRFRGRNEATDVLSFPAEGPFPGSSAEEIAGDLAISVPAALRQAAEQGHSLSTEIKVLILHGLLHLAGGDHEADAGQMARRERLLRGRLGLPQGLIERGEAPVRSGSRSPKKHPSGAKAHTVLAASAARLKSCPDTKPGSSAGRSLVKRPASKRAARAKRP
jgi:probable rRNA maturation factor